jgi:choline dehydrogenase-like flavoprotein
MLCLISFIFSQKRLKYMEESNNISSYMDDELKKVKIPKNRKYEFLIVGSGAGGATLGKELALQGRNVMILERGKYEQSFGGLRDIARFYDINSKSETRRTTFEGVQVFRAFAAGGTTIVSCGNGVRSLEKELSELGINLDEEFKEAECEMNVTLLEEKFLSDASRKIKWAAEILGYQMNPMPKFIDFNKCKKCGKCIAGCPHHAKWSATNFLEEALYQGASVSYETVVQRVLIKKGQAKGVVVVGPQGEKKIYADTVILAAGGLATPIILAHSGIKESGNNLFLDLFVNTFGETRGINQLNEPIMAMVNDEFLSTKGFIISPFINRWEIGRYAELGKAGLLLKNNNLMGLMTKIADSTSGYILPDGNISKPITMRDRKRLKEGSSLAKEIMIKAGTRKSSLVDSAIQGAHPGGTAAIGKVVDNNLQTKVDNLFVCDASVLPVASALPPILTIVALAKRLAKTLSS